MIVKLLTEHHLELLSLKGGCRGLSESSLVRMSNCWKSHAVAQSIIAPYPDNMSSGIAASSYMQSSSAPSLS